jgi:glycogenin glucosyltransferase
VFSNVKKAAESSQSWVTLATNDSYALGALVLAHSLKRVATTRRMTILVANAVTPPIRALLEAAFDGLVDVDPIDSGDFRHLQLLERPDLGITFTKLHCWRLTQYSKCVFLDADTLVTRDRSTPQIHLS